MSDLCYNCGDCHLPRPCAHGLKHCDICGQFGHAYNFCPMGVRLRDPWYQYWALCHNCDKWHLPDPCQEDLHRCKQCGNHGHKEYFCPVHPISRQETHTLSNPQTGNFQAGVKRQRTSDSDVSLAADGSEVRIPMEVMRSVRGNIAREVFQLVARGFTEGDVLQYITNSTPKMPFTGNEFGGNDVNQGESTGNGGALAPNNIDPQGLIMPSSTVYTAQHERFANGELAQSLVQNVEVGPKIVNDPSMPDKTQNPRNKAPRKRNKPPCAACKRAKKGCTHQDNADVTEGLEYPQVNPVLPAMTVAENPFTLDPVTIPGLSDAKPATTTAQFNPDTTQTPAGDTSTLPKLAKGSLAHILSSTEDVAPSQGITEGYHIANTNQAPNDTISAGDNIPRALHGTNDGFIPQFSGTVEPSQAINMGDPEPKKGKGRPKRNKN